MRGLVRGFTIVALPLAIIAADPGRAGAQGQPSRALPVAEPLYPTRVEALLGTPNLVLVTDYYWIDTRFGPNMRIDAVIVEALDTGARVKGVRVHVRDDENKNRQEGTSYLDIDELMRLSKSLTAMAERAGKWAYDDRQATELSLTTNGGFRLAIRQSAREPRAFLSTGLIDPAVTSIELADLPTLKHAFDQALAILTSK